jgi:hypothetical protein
MGCFKLLKACAWGLTGLLFVGCVQGTDEPDMGEAKLVKGWSPTGTANDYAPAGAAGSVAGPSSSGALTDPSGPAGVNPGSSGTPAGAAALPPTGGAAAMAGTGAGTAGSGAGGAGGAGVGIGGMGGSSGAGGANGAAGSAPLPPSGQPGTLTVSITSDAIGGRYAPRNVGAIWIETGSGQFVKTIERWAAIRAGDLRGWRAASGGWGFEFFGSSSSPDAVDVVTGATLLGAQEHTPGWAMKDVSGMVVPDGAYKVVLEVADGSNATAEVMFQKGPMPQTVSAPAGGRGYSEFTVSYMP